MRKPLNRRASAEGLGRKPSRDSLRDRRCEVKFGKTIEVAKFEFVRVDVSYGGRIPEGMTAEEAYDEAWGTVEEQLDKKVEAACKSSSQQVVNKLRREAKRARRER